MKEIKKGKITMTVIIGIMCFILVYIMFMQFKVVKQTDITAIETMRESELRLELANWNEKYNELNYYRWTIERKEDNKILGCIYLNIHDEKARTEAGG